MITEIDIDIVAAGLAAVKADLARLAGRVDALLDGLGAPASSHVARTGTDKAVTSSLREMREARGLTVAEAAARAGMTSAQLCKLERHYGRGSVTVGVATRIAAAYGVSLGEIVAGVAASPPSRTASTRRPPKKRDGGKARKK